MQLQAMVPQGTTRDAYEKQSYTTQRIVGKAPSIDGFIDEACWDEGIWFDSFVQQQPLEGALPSEKTAFKILYDDENLYVAIQSFDSEPDKIDRRLARRDAFAGDMVGIALDSYQDRRSAFEFSLSAAGGKLDLLHQDNWGFDFNWDAVWDGDVSVNDSSWIAEMRIPLSQLRFAEQDEHIWGLHVYRWLHRLNEESQFTLIPLNAQNMTMMFGDLHGLQGIKPKHRLELMPYGRGGMTSLGAGEGDGESEGDYAAGLDAKVGLGSNFTLDLTVNPDFGQVEADPSNLNLTAFETFYGEKRPFFIEGSSLFDFSLGGDRLFYSRRIGEKPRYNPTVDGGYYPKSLVNTPILGAAKLSGKSKHGLAVGLIQAMTMEQQTDIVDADGVTHNRAIQPATNFLVGRIQQDLNNSNTVIGGIFTSTNRDIDKRHLQFLNHSAQVVGFDIRQQWLDKTYYAQLKLAGSRVAGERDALIAAQRSPVHYYQRPDASEFNLDSSLVELKGYALEMLLGKAAGGKFRYAESVYLRSPGYELNDLGYLRQADLVDQSTTLSYVVTDPGKRLRNYSASLTQSSSWNYDKEPLTGSLSAEFDGKLNSLWGLNASISRSRYQLNTRRLRGGPALYLPPSLKGGFSSNSDSRKNVVLSYSWYFAQAEEQSLQYSYMSPSISWQATNTLDMSTGLSYTSNKDHHQYLSTVATNAGDEYILGHLDQKSLSMTFRFDYLLSRDLSLQYYASPYVSTGEYSHYKVLQDPRSKNDSQRFHYYSDAEITAVEDGFAFASTGSHGPLSLSNPDFSFGELRSNLVLRYEYRPGSTAYLVWSQTRGIYGSSAGKGLSDTLGELGRGLHDDIIMLKVSHWISK